MTGNYPVTTDQIVVFILDELLYALPLQAVVKVIHAIEIRHLPKAPEIISGIINVQDQIVPVVDIRKRFGLEAKEIGLDDRMIIAHTGKRHVAFLADTVTGIKDMETWQQEPAKVSLPFTRHIKGIAKIENELILIYDLEKFLSLDEEQELEKAIKTKS